MPDDEAHRHPDPFNGNRAAIEYLVGCLSAALPDGSRLVLVVSDPETHAGMVLANCCPDCAKQMLVEGANYTATLVSAEGPMQ